MAAETLIIFSDRYPNDNGEVFLHHEVNHLSHYFRHIVILPLVSGNQSYQLPGNVIVVNPGADSPTYVRNILRKHFFSILQIMLFEILYSPHRKQYTRKFRTQLTRLVGYISQAERLKPILDAYESDKTLFYSYWFNEWGIRLSLYKKLFNRKFRFISRIHGYDFDEAQQESGYHLFRAFELQSVHKVISISEYGKRYVQARYPKYKDKIYVSRLGVAEQTISQVPPEEKEELLIVSCSSLIALKRVQRIPQILQHLDRPVRWIHFGDGPLMAELQQEIKTLPSHIKAELRGNTANAEILDFYKHHAIDLFMNVSELEGIPVTLMEAISFGIPVLGCNICGVPEIVTDKTGILLEKDFQTHIAAEEIEYSVPNKLRNTDFRKAVKTFADEHYNTLKNYEQFRKTYLN